MTQVTLKELLQQLAEERNLDLRGYKHSSLERRLRHRMFQIRVGSYADYSAYIRDNPAEVNELLNAVLINVTQFFRDPQAWELLRSEFLPELAQSMTPGSSFRAWSAGCATGEEAYSLAILLMEHFKGKPQENDIKVYATDVDEQALKVARRGEYTAEKLRHVRPEWQEKYFTGDKLCHVNRDIRRLVIFGHSNLVSDAPISHVQLLLCRNVLIYFDSPLQKQILYRLHYGLEPRGVLMLGKAESQMGQSSLFRVLNSKWRIFQRFEPEDREYIRERRMLVAREEVPMAKASQDHDLLKLYHEALLETLQPGVLVLDSRGVIISDNEAVARLWNLKEKIAGRSIEETAIPSRCPELLVRLETIRKSAGQTSFEYASRVDDGDEERNLAVTLKAIVSPGGGNVGTLIHVEDTTPRQKLQNTAERLQTTSQELQSTNEELETTNEELQSTNEELETTNEELQSTNEELETTNEELQALNEELATTNEELEVRTKELDDLSTRYSAMLAKVPLPLMLVADEGRVQLWNENAENFFGLSAKSVVGLRLEQLPFPESLRKPLARQYREALARGLPKVLRNKYIEMEAFRGPLDIRFTPVTSQDSSTGMMIIMFEGFRSGVAADKVVKRRAQLTRRARRPRSKRRR